MQLPMCIAGRFGQVQVFLLKGETPLLCGHPIIESLSVVMCFQNKKVRMDSGPWRSATIGLHGGYLLPLWEPEQPMDSSRSWTLDFDLRLAPEGEVDPMSLNLRQFEDEEQAFALFDDCGVAPTMQLDGHALPRHQLRTIDEHLQAESNHIQGVVTSVLHEKGRKIWEVYAGKGRAAEIAVATGAQVKTFMQSCYWLGL